MRRAIRMQNNVLADIYPLRSHNASVHPDGPAVRPSAGSTPIISTQTVTVPASRAYRNWARGDNRGSPRYTLSRGRIIGEGGISRHCAGQRRPTGNVIRDRTSSGADNGALISVVRHQNCGRRSTTFSRRRWAAILSRLSDH